MSMSETMVVTTPKNEVFTQNSTDLKIKSAKVALEKQTLENSLKKDTSTILPGINGFVAPGQSLTNISAPQGQKTANLDGINSLSKAPEVKTNNLPTIESASTTALPQFDENLSNQPAAESSPKEQLNQTTENQIAQVETKVASADQAVISKASKNLSNLNDTTIDVESVVSKALPEAKQEAKTSAIQDLKDNPPKPNIFTKSGNFLKEVGAKREEIKSAADGKKYNGLVALLEVVKGKKSLGDFVKEDLARTGLGNLNSPANPDTKQTSFSGESFTYSEEITPQAQEILQETTSKEPTSSVEAKSEISKTVELTNLPEGTKIFAETEDEAITFEIKKVKDKNQLILLDENDQEKKTFTKPISAEVSLIKGKLTVEDKQNGKLKTGKTLYEDGENPAGGIFIGEITDIQKPEKPKESKNSAEQKTENLKNDKNPEEGELTTENSSTNGENKPAVEEKVSVSTETLNLDLEKINAKDPNEFQANFGKIIEEIEKAIQGDPKKNIEGTKSIAGKEMAKLKNDQEISLPTKRLLLENLETAGIDVKNEKFSLSEIVAKALAMDKLSKNNNNSKDSVSGLFGKQALVGEKNADFLSIQSLSTTMLEEYNQGVTDTYNTREESKEKMKNRAINLDSENNQNGLEDFLLKPISPEVFTALANQVPIIVQMQEYENKIKSLKETKEKSTKEGRENYGLVSIGKEIAALKDSKNPLFKALYENTFKQVQKSEFKEGLDILDNPESLKNFTSEYKEKTENLKNEQNNPFISETERSEVGLKLNKLKLQAQALAKFGEFGLKS